jgi:hypothetical protein
VAGAEAADDFGAVLRARIAEEGGNPDETPYDVAMLDLDGDADEDALALLQGTWCGTGGCSLFVYERTAAGFRPDSDLSLVQAPFIVADGLSDGWRDLILFVSGGGATARYVALAHGDDGYPANPSLIDGLTAPGPFDGDVVFARGDLTPIEDFAGVDPNASDLWNQPFLHERLRALLREDYDVFVELVEDCGPLAEQNGSFFAASRDELAAATGEEESGEDAGIFLADPTQNVIRVWLRQGGAVRVYDEVPVTLYLPDAVQAALGRWNGAQ